jgi:fructose-1,6-bisphosphatase/inositol monophosphatase family enzyme
VLLCLCINSTTNFVHTNPLTCVSIGLTVNREPVLAVVYAPCQKEMFIAVKGYGAYINGKRMQASGAKSISDAIVVRAMRFVYAFVT